MILLDPVIRIAALADPDRFHLAPRPVLQPGCRREALVPKEKLCLVNSAGVQLETHLALTPHRAIVSHSLLEPRAGRGTLAQNGLLVKALPVLGDDL
jgi:hypothetical protein